jgi:hypothetical protein
MRKPLVEKRRGKQPFQHSGKGAFGEDDSAKGDFRKNIEMLTTTRFKAEGL